MQKLISVLVATTALLVSAACTVHDTQVPSPTGPSELGQSLKVSATPDSLPQDGTSQSLIVVQAFNPGGQPISNLSLKLTLSGAGGALASTSLVTGSDGRATTTFTAPPPLSSGRQATTAVLATPTGSDAATAPVFSAQITLTPTGAVQPPSGGNTGGTPPTATFSVSPSSPGVNETVFFNASTSSAAPGHSIKDYSWTFGDGSTGSGLTVTHAYATAGAYAVQLKTTDDTGQSTTSAAAAVSVGSPPAPTSSFTFSPATPGRFDEVVFDASSSLTAQGQTIVDVAWNFGDGTAVIHCPGDPSCITTNGTNRISAHTFQTAASFIVNLVVTDSAGRIGSFNKTVSVDLAMPNVRITASPGSPHPGDQVNFNSDGTTYFSGSNPPSFPVSFAWSFGDGTSSVLRNPSKPGGYASLGSYTVTLSVTDNKGRVGVNTALVTVVPVTPAPPPTPPAAHFTFGPPSPKAAVTSVLFDGNGSTGSNLTYSWNFGDGNPPTAPAAADVTINHTYGVAGAYQVTLKVTDTGTGLSNTSAPQTVTVVP